MASHFHLFGAVLARFFFHQFSIVDSKAVQSPLLLKYCVASCCLLASHFHLFGVVLARFFFPQFSIMDSKNGAKECIV